MTIKLHEPKNLDEKMEGGIARAVLSSSAEEMARCIKQHLGQGEMVLAYTLKPRINDSEAFNSVINRLRVQGIND